VERVEQPPAERKHDDVAAPHAGAGGRAVREAEVAQQLERRGREVPAGRPEAGELDPEIPHATHAALEQLPLGAAVQPGPRLVAPAVVGDLVAGRVELAQRVRVQLGVQALDEERGVQPELVEQLQDPRQRARHREVMAERLVVRPLAALEVGDLA
jgi:hypothetical protein